MPSTSGDPPWCEVCQQDFDHRCSRCVENQTTAGVKQLQEQNKAQHESLNDCAARCLALEAKLRLANAVVAEARQLSAGRPSLMALDNWNKLVSLIAATKE